MKEQILYYAIRYQGDWNKIATALKKGETWQKVSYPGNYVTIVDQKYPQKLRNLKYPPWILFFEGNIDYVDRHMLAIIGSRNNTEYGKKACVYITMKLKQRYTIVSGLAKGIDAIAHKEAMDHHTIGVVGCGLNVIYPKENIELYRNMKRNHLLLSEYPYDVKPLAHHFLWRNRIIACLAKSIVVIEGSVKSGTQRTVSEALELGKTIYVVPHQLFDEQGKGCNLLIGQGENILSNDEDIDMI